MGKSPQFAYPVQPQVQEDGRALVTFPDISEALTDGATVVEALQESIDCLIAALGGYVKSTTAVPFRGLHWPAGDVSSDFRRSLLRNSPCTKRCGNRKSAALFWQSGLAAAKAAFDVCSTSIIARTSDRSRQR